MDENVNEFLWQMVIVGLMISAFGIFLVLNQGITKSFEVVDIGIADQRALISDTEEALEAKISGASIIYQIYSGISIPVQVEGTLYQVGVAYDMPLISAESMYEASYVIDTDGKLVQINYERVYP